MVLNKIAFVVCSLGVVLSVFIPQKSKEIHNIELNSYRDVSNKNKSYFCGIGNISYDDDYYLYNKGDEFDPEDFYYDGIMPEVEVKNNNESDSAVSLSDMTTTGILGVFILFVLQILPFGLFFLLVLFVLRKKIKKSNNQNKYKSNIKNNHLIPISFYKKFDKYFSEEVFKEKITSIFTRFQFSWSKKDLRDIQPYFKDTLYAEYILKLDYYIRKHITNIRTFPVVTGIEIKGVKQEGQTDYIVVNLTTKRIDYEIEDLTGKVVRGSKKEESTFNYLLTVCRSVDYRGKKDKGFSSRNCPNCGAPLKINQSSICEYCGSVLKDSEFDWVISSIEQSEEE